MIYDKNRNYSPLDNVLSELGHALRVCWASNISTQRQSPAVNIDTASLLPEEQKKAAALMRVNHSGEIAAQALYRAQATCSKSVAQQQKMLRAADEETDHLAWCAQRICELNSQPSVLTPLWYAGSFAIGALAGCAGDRWSLGFVEETERQVSDHLNAHLGKLPEHDHKSRAIVQQMRQDEMAHAKWANEAGAAELPVWAKALMKKTAGIMTRLSFHI